VNRTPGTSNKNPAKDSGRLCAELSAEEQKRVLREVERYLRWEKEKGLLANARKHPLDERGFVPLSLNQETEPTSQIPPAAESVEPIAETRLSAAQADETLFSLQLRGVRLYEAQVERLDAKHDTTAPLKPSLQTEVRIARTPDSIVGRLWVELMFPSLDSPEYRLRLTLESMFCPKDASTPLPTEDQIDHRLACTILTMLWPYARETAHDLMRRMEVEAFPLPTLDKLALEGRAGTRVEKGKQATTKT